MAMTMEQLQNRMDEEGLRYFIDPKQPALMFSGRGHNGRYNFIVSLENDGCFLQVRTIGFLQSPAEHPHLAVVLQALAEINYRVRLVKFGWDASDGEIVAYGDAWIMDGTLTQAQFSRILANYLPSVDENYWRIKTALEAGKDPGFEETRRRVEQPSDPGGQLPKATREELEKLGKEGPEPGPELDEV